MVILSGYVRAGSLQEKEQHDEPDRYDRRTPDSRIFRR
ncbi:hypothetical protein PhaeoP30_03840 (plasmid) [Phaeobacter inhibens]|nr:hypothetical protein PhaeoP30_03840 [Phaeobacter inhibens]